MADAEKTEIDGFTFELQQLPAWDHVEASAKLLKMVGAGFIPLATLIGPGVEGPETNMKLFGIAVKLMQTAPISEVMELSKMVLKGCIVGGDLDNGAGKRKLGELLPIFDRLFRGKPLTAYKVIAWAIKVNFAGLFAELKSALPKRTPSPESLSSSTSPSPSETDGPAAD